MKLLTILLGAALALGGVRPAAAAPAFQHPGLLYTQESLASLAKRASEPANKAAMEALRRSRFTDLQRPATPYQVVIVAPSAGNAYEAALRGDAQAAHACALMWVITQDARYRDKAIELMDAWAATFQTLKVDGKFTSQTHLEAAWAAPIWTQAADIIRYYNRGAAKWPQDKVAAFDKFLGRLVTTARNAKSNNNNWGTSATLAIMAAAVYQDDRAAYQEALALHKAHLASISKETGALGPDYLRDSWHPQYTILTWLQTCEIAWNQGDDLYGVKIGKEPVPRLAVCLEHFAQLFSGKLPDPPGLQKSTYRNAHLKRQGYQLGYQHFINRKNMAATIPTFAAIVPAWRPGGLDDHFLGWDALTHAPKR